MLRGVITDAFIARKTWRDSGNLMLHLSGDVVAGERGRDGPRIGPGGRCRTSGGWGVRLLARVASPAFFDAKRRHRCSREALESGERARRAQFGITVIPRWLG